MSMTMITTKIKASEVKEKYSKDPLLLLCQEVQEIIIEEVSEFKDTSPLTNKEIGYEKDENGNLTLSKGQDGLRVTSSYFRNEKIWKIGIAVDRKQWCGIFKLKGANLTSDC